MREARVPDTRGWLPLRPARESVFGWPGFFIAFKVSTSLLLPTFWSSSQYHTLFFIHHCFKQTSLPIHSPPPTFSETLCLTFALFNLGSKSIFHYLSFLPVYILLTLSSFIIPHLSTCPLLIRTTTLFVCTLCVPICCVTSCNHYWILAGNIDDIV